ncbi:hypothetical protein [Paraburkholderia caffeinilytica]|uniref:hypothetical protein n=1 Tax=Paraburkholderia caffeinilytica TaxID=1761016 RepID=UPI003DA07BCE
MKLIARILCYLAIAVVGGWYLAVWIAAHPFDMPDFLYHAILFVLQITHNEQLSGDEDVEALGIMCLIAACMVGVGLLCWLLDITVRRLRRPHPWQRSGR